MQQPKITKVGMIHMVGINYDKFIKYLSKRVLTNPEVLYEMQEAYCKENKLPMFCMKTVHRGEGIGQYMLNKYGKYGAIKRMAYNHITGCPKTNKSWCD